mmetsp:Transcript_20900/g.47437  ORF Transcript_20900/g.47437 Transcript_20900/m.47437 type:complete len:281 (-) Transcript_20900:38-880(-)
MPFRPRAHVLTSAIHSEWLSRLSLFSGGQHFSCSYRPSLSFSTHRHLHKGSTPPFRNLSDGGDNEDERRRRRIVQSTEKWLRSIVSGLRLCPYAPPLAKSTRDDEVSLLRIVPFVGRSGNGRVGNDDAFVESVRAEAENLVGPSSVAYRHETTLVAADLSVSSWTWQDFVRLSWRIQTEAVVACGYGDLLQIVLFHPLAVHSMYKTMDLEEDAANYSIRSPFPTIHLLREKDVLQAVEEGAEGRGYRDLEGLPARNKAKLRALGVNVCMDKLRNCYCMTK